MEEDLGDVDRAPPSSQYIKLSRKSEASFHELSPGLPQAIGCSSQTIRAYISFSPAARISRDDRKRDNGLQVTWASWSLDMRASQGAEAVCTTERTCST
jgi:hypothetical protein